MTEATPMNLSWESLNLNEIEAGPAQTERGEVPGGNYNFKLVSAKESPYQPGSTDIDFVITDGPQSKRHFFASLPSPSKGTWVKNAAATLVKRLGIEHQSGESLVDYLNRAASSGASTLNGDLTEETYFSTKRNENVTKPRLQYFSLQSVA